MKKPAGKVTRVATVVRAGGSRIYANDGERLIDEIVLSIPVISKNDYTVDGKPRVEDLEEVMGEPITEGQRDQAFDIHQSHQRKPSPGPVAADPGDDPETEEATDA